MRASGFRYNQLMIKLPETLEAWGSSRFEAVLKQEVAALGTAQLPLQQALTAGSYALDKEIKVLVNATDEDESSITARLGIFYKGVIAGCACADDPTPEDETNEYCELEISINKQTAQAHLELI
jgi:hypothetical protein